MRIIKTTQKMIAPNNYCVEKYDLIYKMHKSDINVFFLQLHETFWYIQMTCMSLLFVTPVPCCPLIRLCKNIYIYVTATFKHSLFCPFNFNFPPKICYKKNMSDFLWKLQIKRKQKLAPIKLHNKSTWSYFL